MTRHVPFDTKYDQIRMLEKSAFICLLVSAVLIFANWILGKFFTVKINENYSHLKDIAQVVSYVSMVIYLALNVAVKILFYIVEKLKRNDLIDNSFGTSYSDNNTTGYYNNDETETGVKKLALNTYESAFHTENTLRLMLYKKTILIIVISVPFLLSIFSKGGNDIIRLLFEISIPLTLLSDYVILIVYYLNVLNINERFKIEFTNLESDELKDGDVPKLIVPIFEYYCIKAWANANLDSKIFNKNNEKISKDWQVRKGKFSKLRHTKKDN